MTKGLKKYEAVVNKQNTTQLNPYNNQPILQPKVAKPTIPSVPKNDVLPKPIIKPQATQTVQPSKTTPSPLNSLEMAKNKPSGVSNDVYGVQSKPIYNPYNVGKNVDQLDPIYQKAITRSLNVKNGLLGEKGIQYNLENIQNKAAQLPQSMVNAGGFLLDTLAKVKFSGISAEGVDRVFNTLENVKNKPQAFTDTLGAIDTVSDFNKSVVEGLKEVKFVQDRSQSIQKKYEGQIGSIDKFAGDVIGNAIDMIPTLAIAYASGGTASMTYMFASAGAKAEEEALNNGATEDEAFTYGVLSGGIEAGTEMLFGGIGGIAKNTMPKWSMVMTNKFNDVFQQLAKSPVAKAFVSQLVDVAGEGFEEVLAEVLGNYAKLVYTEEIKSGKELTNDALYAGLLGMFTSGFMKLGQTATLKSLETVANQGQLSKLSPEKSVKLARTLASNLNYDFEVQNKEDAVTKYATDEKTKKSILSGGAFVVTETREDGKNGSIVVLDDGTGRNVLSTSVMHEVTHVYENTKTYNELTSLVKKHMGDEQYQEYVDTYAKAYKVQQDEMYKSGIRMSESEFIAQQIVQNQLFGLDSGMRTSFIQQLAGEKPSLFNKLSDNIDSFLNKMRTKSLDIKNEDDRNVLEYIQYMENLRNIFRQANTEYLQIKDDLAFDGTEIQPETKMQKDIEKLNDLDIETYKEYDDPNITTMSMNNLLLAINLKPLQRDITKTFNLSKEEISVIFETLYDMSLEAANDTVLMFESVNDALDTKFKQDISKMSDKEVLQYESLILYLKQTHTYLNNIKEINLSSSKELETKNLYYLDDDELTVEQSRLYYAEKELQKFLAYNDAKIIGEADADNLIVLHNLTEEKLQKVLALGGFAMPSLAITKANIPHSRFGEITVVFNKDILKDSPTYTSDAYTPRVPEVFVTFGSNKDLEHFYESINNYSSYEGFSEFRDYKHSMANGWYTEGDRRLDRLFSLKRSDDGYVVPKIVLKIYEDINGKQLDVGLIKSNDYATRQSIENILTKTKNQFLKSYGAKEYFRNDVDLFTPSGNRKGPEKLLTESNLSSLVKYMRSKGELVGKESNFDFGLKQRKALMNNVMKSPDEVALNRDLIKWEDDRDFDNYINTQDQILVSLNRASEDIVNEKISLNFIDVLDDFLTNRNNIDINSINKYFKEKGYDLTKIIEDLDLIDDINYEYKINNPISYSELLNIILTNIRDKQVAYFESKPRRAVRFSEIETILLPKYSSQELKDSLNYQGIPFIEYDNVGNEYNANGRLELIENMKEVQFQLVPTFKEDSNGLELTDEQLGPILLSKALDENGNIKLFNRMNKDGYYNIRNPFDTRGRRNAALVDKFIKNNNIELVNGLLNERDANLFIAFMNEKYMDMEYDGIIYNDNGTIGYLPLHDSQFYPLDSLEYTNTLLNDLKAGTGVFSNLDKQVNDMEQSFYNQTIQANKEHYVMDYVEYLKFNTTPQDLYESNEDFKSEVDEVFDKYRDTEYETPIEEIKEEMFLEFKKEQQYRFKDDYDRYNAWVKIEEEFKNNQASVIKNDNLRQQPISEFKLSEGRLEYGLPILTHSESLSIIQKTKENFDKDRFNDVYEMVDPKILIQFKDFDRLSKPMGKDNFKRIFNSVMEEGFQEPIWLMANENTGFTFVGEGNHRVYLALMVGLDRVPVVATRGNYYEPRMVTPTTISNGGFVNVNDMMKLDTYTKPSNISPDFKETEIQFQLTQQQEEYFKDSKARDKYGNLIELYHGTPGKRFNVFDKKKLGKNTGNEDSKLGFFFASHFPVAETYSRKNDPNYNLDLMEEFIESISDEDLIKIAKAYNEFEKKARNSKRDYFDLEDEIENIKYDLLFVDKNYESAGGIDDHRNIVNIIKDIQFSNNQKLADKIIKDYEQKKSIMYEVYLNLKNPFVIEDINAGTKQLEEIIVESKANGYDGVIMKNVRDQLLSVSDDYMNYPLKSNDIYIAFDSNQIKNVDNLNPTSSDDIRFQLDDETGQSRFATTAQQNATEEVKQSLENDIANGKLNYQVMSDVISVREAHKQIEKNGIDEELANLNRKLKMGEIPTKVEIAVGEILIKKLSQERRTQEAVDLITSIAVMGTELGQAIQALSLLNKLSPTGQLMALEKGIRRIEKSYEKLGKPNPNLRIPEEYRNYFIELEGRKQDLQDSQNEYNNLVERMTQLENEIKGFEEQNKSIQELNQIEAQIDVLKEQQKIDVETQKRIDGLQLELDELNALPKVSDDLKQLQTGLKSEIRNLTKMMVKDVKAQENIFNLEAQLKVLKLEVGEDALERIKELKQQVKDTKAAQKTLKKLNKMLDEMTNKKAIEDKIDEVKRVIAKQMPVSFMDKVNAWRYLSMLGNPRTHIRNILGNGFFYPVYVAKDVVGVAMEKFLPQAQRTKSLNALSDVELKQFVLDDFKEMQKVIATTTKYDLTMDLAFNKTIFKTNWLESVRNKNFDWLEKEDVLFMRLAYTHSLGMVIKARGWDYNNLTEEQLSEARTIATDAARKATYRDASKFATWLNQIEKGGKIQAFFMGTIIPFKKTPINILKRGIEYSPVSILVGIKQFAFDIKSGKATPAQALDSITTGLSGMAIMGLGGLLFNMGLLNVGDDDDESDKKRFYDRSLGKQRYSLNILGGTYTIDWIVPAIMPLIIGGEMAKAMSKESNETFANQVLNASFSILDPVFELSMLQGVTQTLTSYSSSGTETVGNIISQSVANYFGQFIPTLSGQLARIIDPTQRSTVATKESPITKFGEQTLRKLANKVPFLSMVNAPVVDVRGEEVINFANPFTRAMMNLFSPGYYKEGTLTEQDKEILKIYELTQDSNVIPKEVPSTYKFQSKTYLLDNKGTSEFGKVLGELSYTSLDELINSSGYKRLATDEKTKLIEKMYDYAYFVAKEKDFNARDVRDAKGNRIKFSDDEYTNMKKAVTNGLSIVDYLLIKSEFGKIKADKVESKKDKFISYLRKSGYTDKLSKILPIFDYDLFD